MYSITICVLNEHSGGVTTFRNRFSLDYYFKIKEPIQYMITEERYNNLIPFDKALGCAYHANYAYIAPNDLRKVLEIYYGPDWKNKVPKQVFSCSHCKLQELKKIAGDYFNYEHN